MSRGRHRQVSTIARRISRISMVVAAGSAGIAAPLLTAGSAHAAAPTAAQHAPAHAKTASQTSAQTSKTSADGTYTVVSGDTLFKIANAHDIKGGWQSLYQANKKTVGGDPDLILPGQQLTLASAPAPKAPSTPAPQQQSSDTSAQDTSAQTSTSSYGNNLDGWIRQALDIMHQHGIPGTYEGIHRNIMRESSGNPNAINNWDINAQNGTPSIGLLQVIKPTFDAYHVAGTAWSQYDPVANIVAACNYAADVYGSIDNVNSAY
jgi:LysM repeat protein